MPQSPNGQNTAYPGRRNWRVIYLFAWLAARPELTTGAKLLYSMLAAQAGGANVARNWTVPMAARALAASTRSVSTWFGDLIRVGLLERQPPAPDEVGHRYFFLDHPWMSGGNQVEDR